MFLLPDQVYGEERSRSSKLRVSSKPTLITSSEGHRQHGMGTPGSKKIGVLERELSSSGCDPDPDEEDMDGYGQVRTYFTIAGLVTQLYSFHDQGLMTFHQSLMCLTFHNQGLM